MLFVRGLSDILNVLKNAKMTNLKRVKLSNNDQTMLKQTISWILSEENSKLERLQINVQCKYLQYVMETVHENIKRRARDDANLRDWSSVFNAIGMKQ